MDEDSLSYFTELCIGKMQNSVGTIFIEQVLCVWDFFLYFQHPLPFVLVFVNFFVQFLCDYAIFWVLIRVQIKNIEEKYNMDKQNEKIGFLWNSISSSFVGPGTSVLENVKCFSCKTIPPSPSQYVEWNQCIFKCWYSK